MESSRVGKLFGILASASGAICVLTGAFGAHALRNRLDAHALEVFDKAVRWQAVHALALLAVALLSLGRGARRATLCTWLSGLGFAVGTVLFSGSLYALALSGVRWLGAITPIGGTAFVVGWVSLGVAFASFGRPADPASDRPDGGTEQAVR